MAVNLSLGATQLIPTRDGKNAISASVIKVQYKRLITIVLSIDLH